MVLGVGLLIGIAVGASWGGWWVLAGIVLAGAAAGAAAWRGVVPLPLLRVTTLLALGMLAAATFAAYLAPERPELVPELVAVLVVAVATAVVAFGGAVSARTRAMLAGVLLAAAVAFTAVCFAIEPPGGLEPLILREWHPVTGTLLSALLLFGLFAPLELSASRGRALLRIVVGVAAALAVALGALRQLGPTRLGLAETTLRDAFVVAGGTELRTMFGAVVVIATVPALIAVLAAATSDTARTPTARPAVQAVLCGLIVAAGAALITPAVALLLASVSALAAVVAGWALGERRLRAGSADPQSDADCAGHHEPT